MEIGYPFMKPEQLEVAMALVEGRDVFAVLPTSFGKTSAMLACQWHLISHCRTSGVILLS